MSKYFVNKREIFQQQKNADG